MAENKTKPTDVSVDDFLDSVPDPTRREDGKTLRSMMERISGYPARMWGPTIVGYGRYHYKYASGREGEMCRVGFSPRKAKHSLYLMCGSPKEEAQFAPLLARLGKHSRGKGCLYVNKLADIDLAVLEEMVALSWKNSFEKYPEG